MHIKPSVVTGAATIVALVAIGIIVTSTEPSQSQQKLIWMLWAALFLVTWGFVCTLLLLARQSMAQSLWTALPSALAAVGLLMALHQGVLGKRLLQGVLLATLMLSIAIWWKIRRMQKKQDMRKRINEYNH